MSLNGKLFLLKEVLKNSEDYFIIFNDLGDNLFSYRNVLKLLNKTVIKIWKKACWFNIFRSIYFRNQKNL